MADESLVVHAPATSANLGPGFDVMAAAIDLSNSVVITRRPGPLTVRVEGEGQGVLPEDDTNLVCTAMRQGLDSLDGLAIECRNRIPLGRGLGSSAATVCAGLVAANALGGLRWAPGDILRRAADVEGHADNAGACLEGGLVVVSDDRGAPCARRIDVDAQLGFVAVIPAHEVSTDQARKALPGTVPLGDVAFNIGAAAGMVLTLTQGRLDELAPLLVDRVHEPYREANVPGIAALRAMADGERIFGATVSGSGPSSLVWCRVDAMKAVEAEVAGVLRAEGVEARARASRLGATGVRARWSSDGHARLERSIG